MIAKAIVHNLRPFGIVGSGPYRRKHHALLGSDVCDVMSRQPVAGMMAAEMSSALYQSRFPAAWTGAEMAGTIVKHPPS